MTNDTSIDRYFQKHIDPKCVAFGRWLACNWGHPVVLLTIMVATLAEVVQA